MHWKLHQQKFSLNAPKAPHKKKNLPNALEIASTEIQPECTQGPT